MNLQIRSRWAPLLLLAVPLAAIGSTARLMHNAHVFRDPAGPPPTFTIRPSPSRVRIAAAHAVTVTPSATARPSRIARPSPLPSATNAATPSGTPTVRTGGITYDLSALQAIQGAADRRDPAYGYALDPVRVTLHDLPGFGFRPGPIAVVSPAPPAPSPTAHLGEDGRPETDVIVRFDGAEYWIVLNQFVRQGPGGIWSVITITPM